MLIVSDINKGHKLPQGIKYITSSNYQSRAKENCQLSKQNLDGEKMVVLAKKVAEKNRI